MKSFAPIFFALFVSSASAGVTGSGIPALAIRQVAPPTNAQCAASCGAVGKSIIACQKGHETDDDAAQHLAQCSCSDDISSQWGQCYSCAVANGMDKAAADKSLAGLVDACQKGGTPFKNPPTVSASGSGGSGSSSGSGSSAASAAGSTSTSSSKNSGVANFGTAYAVGLSVIMSGISSAFLYA